MKWVLFIIALSIILTLILALTTGTSVEPNECAERLFNAAMTGAQVIPPGMNVSDAMAYAEDNKEKIISRLDMTLAIYC